MYIICVPRLRQVCQSQMNALIGDTLLDGSVDTIKTKLIGLYFSKNKCKWCKEFSPLLKEMYSQIQMIDSDALEIIFVSSDPDQCEYDISIAGMPWHKLPFEYRDIKQSLISKYQFKTVPQLVFVDDKGDTIEVEGRRLVERMYGRPHQLIDLLTSKLDISYDL